MEIFRLAAFPKKFIFERWLENGAYVDQALKVWNYMSLYIEGDPLPENKNYQYLAEAFKDSQMKAKLTAFRFVIIEYEPVLRRFQSLNPFAPFLHTSLQELVTSLLRRSVKPLKLDKVDSISNLLNLDFSHADNLIPVKSIDIGFEAKKFLKEIKGSDS